MEECSRAIVAPQETIGPRDAPIKTARTRRRYEKNVGEIAFAASTRTRQRRDRQRRAAVGVAGYTNCGCFSQASPDSHRRAKNLRAIRVRARCSVFIRGASPPMTAMPVMLGVLCLMAIAYRYYSAFLAARVATLDDARTTPAIALNDGHNYHPTSKWVLFGHHFAAISGAGPLIGPVLAAQFGYMPGLLWIVIGV